MSVPLRAAGIALSVMAVGATLACSPKSDQPAAAPTTPSSSVSATPSAPAGGDVAAAIERGVAAKPYSGTAEIRTEMGGTTALTMTGRVNLNTQLSGTFRMILTPGASTEQTIEQVVTATHVYIRQGSEPWRKMTHAELGAGQLPNLSLSSYAQILARQGGGAMKGLETKDGVKAYHLTGRVTAEQVKKIEPSLADRLSAEGLDGFECDVWVDEQGRAVRLEQQLKMQGRDVHNTFTLRDFGPATTVTPPSGA